MAERTVGYITVCITVKIHFSSNKIKHFVQSLAHQAYHIASITFSYLQQLTIHAKKAAEEASKHALEASKQAADVGKKNFEDLSYVGKSTLGDLTKTAKEAAVKKGLILIEPDQPKSPQPSSGNTVATTQGNTSGHFFSALTSDISGMAQSTSSMFSGFFGQKQSQPAANQQQKTGGVAAASLSGGAKLLGFDPFPNRKGLVERTPLIRHAGPKQTQEDLQRQQQAERTSSNSENQAFLRDVSDRNRYFSHE